MSTLLEIIQSCLQRCETHLRLPLEANNTYDYHELYSKCYTLNYFIFKDGVQQNCLLDYFDDFYYFDGKIRVTVWDQNGLQHDMPANEIFVLSKIHIFH